MYHQDDERSLRNMLGLTGEFPTTLDAEYKIRKRMFCAAGGSGSIGPVALVDLVRSVGLEPPKQEEPTRIDFTHLPRDTTRIAYFRYGDWHPGVYLGKGDAGKVYVRLDGEEMVREVSNRPDILRLEDRVVRGIQELAESIVAALDTALVPVHDVSDAFTTGPAAVPTTTPVPVAAVDYDGDPGDDEDSVINWGAKPPGITVWGRDDTDGAVEGKLSHVDEDGQVFVLVDGDETARPFDAEDVFLA